MGAWVGLVWLRIGTSGRALVNAVMNIRVIKNAEKFLTSSEPVSFSRRTLLHEFVI
jgi:hypothetical protein